MKKMILIGIGLVAAAAFIGFDAVDAFVDKTRDSVRSTLMSPEVELQAQLAKAKELAQRCGESVVNGRVALARLDRMIADRERELERRRTSLERDRTVLEHRRAMLADNREVYFVNREEVSHRTLNRDAVLRARAYATDRGITDHLAEMVSELKTQRSNTEAEIEEAVVEQRRLEGEVKALEAELQNLKARKAVAQTREEAGFLLDRSAFDEAYDKIAEVRAKIAEQNEMLDFYSRTGPAPKGLLPADVQAAEENALDVIDEVLDVKASREPVQSLAR